MKVEEKKMKKIVFALLLLVAFRSAASREFKNLSFDYN